MALLDGHLVLQFEVEHDRVGRPTSLYSVAAMFTVVQPLEISFTVIIVGRAGAVISQM